MSFTTDINYILGCNIKLHDNFDHVGVQMDVIMFNFKSLDCIEYQVEPSIMGFMDG